MGEKRWNWIPYVMKSVYLLSRTSKFTFSTDFKHKILFNIENFPSKKMFCLKCQFDNEKPTKCLTHNDEDLLYSFEISISNVRWNESSTHSISAMQSCFLFRFPFFCCFLIIFILFSDRERERWRKKVRKWNELNESNVVQQSEKSESRIKWIRQSQSNKKWNH